VFKQTNEIARVLGLSEAKVRRMRKRGELSSSARTTKGDALFTDDDIARAKHHMAQARMDGRRSQ
jgi:hypothetical protein